MKNLDGFNSVISNQQICKNINRDLYKGLGTLYGYYVNKLSGIQDQDLTNRSQRSKSQ